MSRPPRPSWLPWWPVPAAAAFLAVVGAGVYLAQPDAPPAGPPAGEAGRTVPPPVPDQAARFHSLTTGVEHGIRVIRIQVVAGGDELVIDAATGRLLEARPAPRPPNTPAKPMVLPIPVPG
jgi:hypothetical protein